MNTGGRLSNVLLTNWQRQNFAVVGCVAFLLTFAIPTRWDFSLILLGICGILTAISGASGKPHFDFRLPLFPETFLFLLAIALSTLFSADLSISILLGASFLPGMLVFYLISAHFETATQLRAIFLALAAVTITLSTSLLLAAWQNPGLSPSLWVWRLGVPVFVVPNDSIFLAIIAPFSLALLMGDEKPFARWIAATALILNFTAIIALQSRGGLIAFLLGSGIMLSAYRPRYVLIGIPALASLFLLQDWTLGFPMLAKLSVIADYSDRLHRVSLWLAAWSMFLDKPFLGHGPHTYGLSFMNHMPDIALPSWSRVAPSAFWPHSLYFEVAAEQGLLGFSLLTILLVRAGLVLRQAWLDLDGQASRYALACLSGLIAFCIAGVFELTFLRIWVVVLLFVLLGAASCLARIAKDRT